MTLRVIRNTVYGSQHGEGVQGIDCSHIWVDSVADSFGLLGITRSNERSVAASQGQPSQVSRQPSQQTAKSVYSQVSRQPNQQAAKSAGSQVSIQSSQHTAKSAGSQVSRQPSQQTAESAGSQVSRQASISDKVVVCRSTPPALRAALKVKLVASTVREELTM